MQASLWLSGGLDPPGVCLPSSCCIPVTKAPCWLCSPCAAVVRERVYDIRRAVTVTEGEPMEMES